MRSPSSMNLRLLLSAGALASLIACTTTKDAVREDDAQRSGASHTGAGANSEGAPEVKINSRALLHFEDATRAWEAQKHARNPDYGACARKFEAALAADDRLAEADYDLGVLAERQGHLDEAQAHYKTALKKKPSLKPAAENLAVLAQNRGDTQTALATYAEIARQFPDDAQSRARLAELFRESGDQDRAMDYARQALIRDPKSVVAQKTMMLSYFDRKQMALARLVGIRTLKLDDSDPEIYQTLGLIFLNEKQEEKAAVQFNKAASLRQDFTPAQVMLAKLALKNEDYAGAEQHLRRVLQADGKNAEAHLNLGVAYKGMGQFDKAMLEYDAAEKLNPKLAAIYLNRGIILHRFKDAPEKGIEYYKKYLELKGGEVAVGAEAPVFTLLKEAEQIVQVKADAARQEAEAKKLEGAQKKQQAELKKAEEAQKPAPGEKSGAPKAQPQVETVKGKPNVAAEPATNKKGEPNPDAPPAGAAKDEPSDGL